MSVRLIIRPAKRVGGWTEDDGAVHVRIGLLGKFTDVTISWWFGLEGRVYYNVYTLNEPEQKLYFQRGFNTQTGVTLEDAIRAYCNEVSKAHYLTWHPKFEGWDE